MKPKSLFVQCYQQIDAIPGCFDSRRTRTNCEGVVTASYSGLVVLGHNDVQPTSDKAPGEKLADCNQSLTGFTTDNNVGAVVAHAEPASMEEGR